jgi:hypothetical protein
MPKQNKRPKDARVYNSHRWEHKLLVYVNNFLKLHFLINCFSHARHGVPYQKIQPYRVTNQRSESRKCVNSGISGEVGAVHLCCGAERR